MRLFLQDMAMQGAAKGLERKIPQVGFEIAKVTQKHNRFKNASHITDRHNRVVQIQLYFTGL